MKKVLLAFTIASCVALLGTAQGQTPAPPAEPAAQPAAAAPPAAAPATMLTDADIKGLAGPKAEDKANGDPGGDRKSVV